MIANFLFLVLLTLATLQGMSAKKYPTPTPKVPTSPGFFPGGDAYNAFAICKGVVTKKLFPNLTAPSAQGGCVRYYRGIDMTGVVTEIHLYFKDGIKTACDCIIACLKTPTSCTNWVYKHTFMTGDGGLRSCTLYSSPNLPSNVTLAYDLKTSSGFDPLQAANNPQAGGGAPLTFLDAANTKRDNFGVSGFTVLDAASRLFC